jgi:hypothetical protein
VASQPCSRPSRLSSSWLIPATPPPRRAVSYNHTVMSESVPEDPRLRVTKVDEFQFLTCLKHEVWGSQKARFKDWRPGDQIAFIVDKRLAALTNLTDLKTPACVENAGSTKLAKIESRGCESGRPH